MKTDCITPSPGVNSAATTAAHQNARCPRCGGAQLVEVVLRAGPHHSKVGCADCGRHIKFNPAPWTLERAMGFVMPFGKHKGTPLAELARTPAGRGYLAWVAEHAPGNVAAAASTLLSGMGGGLR